MPLNPQSDPLNPYSELSEDQHKFLNSIPLAPTPGEQLDAAVKSAERLGSRLAEQVQRDSELARSRFEKRALDPDPPVKINRVPDLTLSDFNPQPPPPAVNGPNAVEQQYPQTYTPPVDPWGALELFDYHAPTPGQIDDITAVRSAMKQAATTILTFCPPSAERTLAIRALHQASMHANSSIVFEGRKIV